MDAQIGLQAAVAAAIAGMAARQVLHDAAGDDPEVVAVVIEAKTSPHGATVDFEYLNRAGMAVGGGSL